jgi:hypothetical protein
MGLKRDGGKEKKGDWKQKEIINAGLLKTGNDA